MEFVFDYAKELETCMVMQDKRWLGEAVINVLDNAIKYSPDGSKYLSGYKKKRSCKNGNWRIRELVFRRMSITKFFNDFTEEVPGRSWKRVVQESDFFYREKLSKNTEVQSW